MIQDRNQSQALVEPIMNRRVVKIAGIFFFKSDLPLYSYYGLCPTELVC